jgi:alanyl-tRNA synthetase
VIRRILRRAIRYYFRYLDQKSPFIFKFVPLLADQFSKVFPELDAQKSFVAKVIEEEEASFLRTLENGEKRISQLMNNAKESGKFTLDGKQVFELYDTFGFPFDLTALIARESGFSVDESGFEIEMLAQKERSRKASETETGDWIILNEDAESEFIGYDDLESKTSIIKFRNQTVGKENLIQVVLEKNPFYGESGGQLGDKGALELFDNQSKSICQIEVIDTKKENDLIILLVKQAGNTEEKLKSMIISAVKL